MRQSHLNSTSLSLHGKYELDEDTARDEPQPIEITYGYSRDHRPDLKQAMLSLICANAANLPVWLATLDGNPSDQKHYPHLWRPICTN